MLKVAVDSPAIDSDYRYTVKTVNEIEKAEINQELFDKVFGEGVVTGEDEFRSRIREGIASYFEKESDKKLMKDLRNTMLAENNLPLPDDFLKRMLKKNQDKQIDEHTFEHEYMHVAEDLKWNLIESKIAEEQSIDVTWEEVHSTARMMVAQQFAQYGVPAPEDEKLNEMATNYLQKENVAENVERNIRSSKVFDYLKKNLKLNVIELPYEEFIEKLKEKTEHEHHFHS
jgi:trigger factor